MTIKTEVANHPQKGKRLVESKSETTIMMLPSEADSSVWFGGVILKHVVLLEHAM
jgi:hypothetical protein